MTLFIVSRMPITTWRSGSVCTVSRKLGITTSSIFNRAADGRNGKTLFTGSFSALARKTASTMHAGIHVNMPSRTLVIEVRGIFGPNFVLCPTELTHGSECCPANILVGILDKEDTVRARKVGGRAAHDSEAGRGTYISHFENLLEARLQEGLENSAVNHKSKH